MSTITKEFTKEQLIEQAKSSIERYTKAVAGFPRHLNVAMDLELARIALASLEAEPVACMGNGALYHSEEEARADARYILQPLFTATPAPVSVPDFGALTKCIVQRLVDYGAADDDAIASAEEFVYNACRAAMLQGAEPVTTANKLPDDFDFDRFNDVVWLEAVASNPHMHSPTTSTIAMVALELNKRLEAGNSPVIPDGWVAVPVEPTEDMIVNGFESEPDERFSDAEEWEAYEAMSGCQQAAHRARLCWSAMIASRPKLKHDLT
ncbi:hypothetical protein ACOTZF_24750 [Enterobacter cloacae complex sp. SHL021]|uniref:hypothetical protein n=1 Tax=Enterobacter cloacae complex TaxID=354276 RepID=UPI00101301EC|nr:hypothetical protein [Enterobacter cloacae]